MTNVDPNKPGAGGSPTPLPTPPDDPAVDAGVVIVQKVIILLGLVGVAVPPVFSNLQTEQLVVSLAISIGGLIWSGYSHLKTRAQLVAARSSLGPRR